MTTVCVIVQLMCCQVERVTLRVRRADSYTAGAAGHKCARKVVHLLHVSFLNIHFCSVCGWIRIVIFVQLLRRH